MNPATMLTRYPVDHRTLSDEDHLIMKVVRLYYEHDLTQAQVAKRMGFSRPKVSRLLAEGKIRGLVKVEIAEPTGDFVPLEISLENRYGLSEALVVASAEDRGTTDLTAGMAGGAVLARHCTRATVLGVAWGRSMRALADTMPRRAFTCKKIVPLLGGMGRVKGSLHSNQIGTTLGEKLDVDCPHLAAPAIARSPQSRAELMEMPGIEEVLAEELCGHTVHVQAEGDGVPVAAVGGGDHVPLLQGGYGPDGDGLLPDVEVRRPVDLPLGVEVVYLLVEGAAEEHLPQEVHAVTVILQGVTPS